ncbi:glycine cleavage system protein T [Hyphomicrobium nitrativorans NL23]|uniref:Glycine cleavage system protein T n=1 Tax=Hyphomicrobium nitrativorans NL23 TaxID=1029756 RepID=V5SCC4_9HYPH|nr:folate-binding protein YgfZ [Hyphomicrobium nitrativorans]AHB48137.1 glycine cleavage system protein T [Hyphomicrobium nitrativorans NL23]
MTYATLLEDRGFVSVTGPDAEKLLGGLITNEMSVLDAAPALYAALLAPQGKILFDFLVVKTADGFLLDTLRARAGELAKRLAIYKLRAAVEIRDASADFVAGAVWGGAPLLEDGAPSGVQVYADPRFSALGHRVIARAGTTAGDLAAAVGGVEISSDAYHAHRIGLGVPEGGRDFAFGDTFPHEALLDQLNGVSFTKGCFVGQEVVSRMQHRTTVRKRVVTVVADAALPREPVPVAIGTVEIGRLGSVAGSRGLALVRIDRVAEAIRDGIPLTAGGTDVRVEVPSFATFRIEVAA